MVTWVQVPFLSRASSSFSALAMSRSLGRPRPAAAQRGTPSTVDPADKSGCAMSNKGESSTPYSWKRSATPSESGVTTCDLLDGILSTPAQSSFVSHASPEDPIIQSLTEKIRSIEVESELEHNCTWLPHQELPAATQKSLMTVDLSI